MAGMLGVRPAAIHRLVKLEQLLAGQRLWCAPLGHFDPAQLFSKVAAANLIGSIHNKCAQGRQCRVDAGRPHLGLNQLAAIQPQIGWGDQAGTQRCAVGLLEPRSKSRQRADIRANRVSGPIRVAQPSLKVADNRVLFFLIPHTRHYHKRFQGRKVNASADILPLKCPKSLGY